MSQLTIWPTAPLARRTDPETSHQAPSIPHLSTLQAAVLAEFHGGPMTDDQLVQRFPLHDPGTVKKRRTELTRAGLLRDTGARGTTRRGRAAVVWGKS